jgi:hypothetical protein
MKERRVVNIDKEDFDKIKKYCDDNALDMPKWLVKLSKEEMSKNMSYLPNGIMKDGTLVVGPFKEKPLINGTVHELVIDGISMYVLLSCKPEFPKKETLTSEDREELTNMCKIIKSQNKENK